MDYHGDALTLPKVKSTLSNNLNEIEGVPFKDIAEQSGESVATLISRKRYAVLHLRNRLSVLKDELLDY